MECKQYPPRGGPPLVCRCRGIPFGTRVLPINIGTIGITAHLNKPFNAVRSGDADRLAKKVTRADLSVPIAIGIGTAPGNVGRDSCCQNIRIEEDVGPPGSFLVPNLRGLKHSAGTRHWFAQKIPEGLKEAGRWKTEVGSWKTEDGGWKHEAGSPGGTYHFAEFHGAAQKPGYDFLFLIPHFLFSGIGNREHRIRLPGLLAGKFTRHAGKTRDKPVMVYKPSGKMNERVGNTGPPPGRTGQIARKDSRQAWKCSSGGGKYPLWDRKHSFGDKKHPLRERKHPLGDWNDSLGDWNDSLGNRNNSLWDRNDSLWYGNDPAANWMDAGPPGGLPVSVWMPNLEGWGNPEGLKIGVKAWEPAGHPPEKVCRSGTPAEAFCVHIKMMVRVRDGTVVHIPVCPPGRRDGTRVFSTAHSNPPGLYVYSQPESRENSGPAVPIAIGSNRGLYLKWSVFAKNAESENNIPVLRTSGYNAVSDSLLLIIYSSNADSPDSYRDQRRAEDADGVRFDQSNADRSRDAVRLQDKTTKGDLTASARPVNVEKTAKGDLSVPIVPIAIGIGKAPDNVGYKLKNLINEAGTIKRRSVLPHL